MIIRDIMRRVVHLVMVGMVGVVFVLWGGGGEELFDALDDINW